MWHWWVHLWGGDNANSTQYLLGSSGWGAVFLPNMWSLGPLAVIAWQSFKRRSCSNPRCWRIGHEYTETHGDIEVHKRACHKHHPKPHTIHNGTTPL